MVVEPVIVVIIDKTRVESYLFWRPYVVEIRRVLKTPQIVVVLEPRHRREQAADGAGSKEKSVAAGDWAGASIPGDPGGRDHAIQSTRVPCQVPSKSANYSKGP